MAEIALNPMEKMVVWFLSAEQINPRESSDIFIISCGWNSDRTLVTYNNILRISLHILLYTNIKWVSDEKPDVIKMYTGLNPQGDY